MKIKTLSIRQPWASMIVLGLKDIENRTWPTKYRGRLLIHAGRTMTGSNLDGFKDFIMHRQPKLSYKLIKELMDHSLKSAKESLPMGGIIGEVMLNDCVTESDSKWFVGDYGFVFSHQTTLPFYACKGQLGFFDVDYPDLKLIQSLHRGVGQQYGH